MIVLKNLYSLLVFLFLLILVTFMFGRTALSFSVVPSGGASDVQVE